MRFNYPILNLFYLSFFRIAAIANDAESLDRNIKNKVETLNEQRQLIKERGWLAINLDANVYKSMPTYERGYIFFKNIEYLIKNRKN